MTEQERIKKVVLDSIVDPRRANSIICPGEIPSTEDEIQLRKHNIPFDVDEPIRKAVIELNNLGFKTAGSCAGHNKPNRGFIAINRTIGPSEKSTVYAVLAKYGLKNIKIKGLSGTDPFTKEPFGLTSFVTFSTVLTPKRFYLDPSALQDTYGITKEEYESADQLNKSSVSNDFLKESREELKDNIDARNKALSRGDAKTVAIIDSNIRAMYRSLKASAVSGKGILNSNLAPDRENVVGAMVKLYEEEAKDIIPKEEMVWPGNSEIIRRMVELRRESDNLFVDAEDKTGDFRLARQTLDAFNKEHEPELDKLRKKEPVRSLAEIRAEVEQAVKLTHRQQRVPAIKTKLKAQSMKTSVAGIREKYNL